MIQQTTLAGEAPASPVVAGAPTRSERWSAHVFAVAVIAALPLILWFGRDHWFFLDEWFVLTRDGLTSPGYLDGYNGHWITLVRLDYRLNFELWGLRSYLPYQVPVVLAHLVAAVLLRQVICRLGVRGWIATSAALAFLFFGSGRSNMVFGFQLSLTGSLACGLALFLLADGPRKVIRRDWWVLGIGVVGLMTSSAFPAILVGFAVTTLVRRGVPVAALYAGSLGAIYLAWYARYGGDTAVPLRLTGQTVRFAGRMFWAVFDALAQGGIGALLVAVAAVGLAAALRRAWRSGTWADAALPLGLAVGWLAFAGATALARAHVEILADTYDSDRYIHVSAALLLPLVASGAEVLARRRALLGAAALAPLVIGLPGNLDELAHSEPVLRGNRQLVFAMAHSPFIDEVPPGTRSTSVGGLFDVPLTTGWLARQAAAGRIPEPDTADPTLHLNATNWVVLTQDPGSDEHPACPDLTSPRTMTLRAGERLPFDGTVHVTVTDGTNESPPRPFQGDDGGPIVALAGPVDVVVRPVLAQPAGLCATDGSPGTPELSRR
jgi:hypothetical protein